MEPVYLMPFVKSEGEEVFLSCDSLMPSNEITWSGPHSSLPPDASINHGVLHIPHITKDDEGTYTCVAKQGDLETENEFRIQVDDFVPVLFGNDNIEFAPLADEQLKNFEVELTVKPAAADGVLFYTERKGDVAHGIGEVDRRPPVVKHLARLENGQLIYEYDIGYGKEELVLPADAIMDEWTTVIVRNNESQASLQLNDGQIFVKMHPEAMMLEGENQPLLVGSQPDEEDVRRPLPGFKGIVSEVVISGENVPLAHGNPSPGVRKFDACRAKPCANGGRCRVANRVRGYTCVCEEPYGGYQCETLSSKCKDEHCNGGICVNSDDMWQCVCPLNATGLRCEQHVHNLPRKSFAFQNKTSFLSVQPPPSLEQMKVSFRLRPEQLSGEKVLLYAASQHGETPPAYMSLSLRDGHIVYAQQHGAERQEVTSAEIPQTVPATAVDVLLMRDSQGISIVLNGQNSSEKNFVPSFSPVTDLYIGGLPPAFKVPDGVPTEAFQGCVEQVTVNSKELDLGAMSHFSSGDLAACERTPVETVTHPLIIEGTGATEEVTTTIEVPEETTTTTEEPTTTSTTTTTTTTSTTTTTITPPEPITFTTEETTTSTTEEPTTTSTSTTTTTTTTTTTAPETTTTTTPEPTAPYNIYLTDKDDDAPPAIVPTVTEAVPEATECSGSLCEDANVTLTPPDVCETHDCGPNGRCEGFNVTHYLCVCNLFYDGPRCGIFKPIEHAAHFNGDAFIEISADELPHITSEKDETLQLRFKTTAPNGLLIWQGQQAGVPIAGEDYFSLAITNGYLHYSYELGGGAAHLVSPIRVADGKEHIVRLERRGRVGSMYLDDLPEVRGVSSGILAMLNVDGNIFIGGIPEISTATGSLHEHNFIGCVADVRLNKQKLDLMGTAIDGKNVRPCEEWLQAKRFLKKRRRS